MCIRDRILCANINLLGVVQHNYLLCNTPGKDRPKPIVKRMRDVFGTTPIYIFADRASNTKMAAKSAGLVSVKVMINCISYVLGARFVCNYIIASDVA